MDGRMGLNETYGIGESVQQMKAKNKEVDKLE